MEECNRLPRTVGGLLNPVTITYLGAGPSSDKRSPSRTPPSWELTAGSRRGIAHFFRWIFLRLCFEG